VFCVYECMLNQKGVLSKTHKANYCYVDKKVQLDATICRHLFTAKSLYMFRASQHPSSGALKTVIATSGIGHVISDGCVCSVQFPFGVLVVVYIFILFGINKF